MGRESKIKKLRKEGILKPVKIDKKRASALKNLFIWITTFLIVSVLIFGVWAYSAKDTEAKVNNLAIKTTDIEKMLVPILKNMQSQGIDPTAKEQEATVNKYRSSIIEMLIDQKVFELYAKSHKISLTKDEIKKKVDEEISNIKKQYKTEEEFEKTLAQSEMKNIENLTKEITTSVSTQLFEDKILKSLYDVVKVTENDAKTFFNSPSQIKAQRILIKVAFDTLKPEDIKKKEDELKAIKDKIYKNTITFDKAIEQFSEDSTKATDKGLKTLFEDAFPEEPELFNEAKKLKINEISGIIKTKYGYNLLKATFINYNKEKYDVPESATVKVINIAVDKNATQEEWNDKKTKATGLAKNLQAGKELFGTIAEQYSSNPDAGKNPSTVYSGQLDAPINDAIFKTLKIGQISDPIQATAGYEIINLISKKPMQKAIFDKIKTKVIEDLVQQKKSEIRTNWLKEQKEKRRISYSNPWVNMTAFYKNHIGGFFEDLINWVKQYTVEPKTPDTNTQTPGGSVQIPGSGGQSVEIPVQQGSGQGTGTNNP
jgi:foldase protein PrsA